MKTPKNILCLLCLFAAIALAGCAIVPRGPIVSHSHEEFRDRPDGLISRDIWKDAAFTRGIYLFTDPTLQTISVLHTNHTALGGSSQFVAGNFSVIVDSNLVPAISATGTAAGNIIGAAVKTAVK
jgi:hypothetical protein